MKILASDYDGTLRINGTVSDADRAAIARFREKGGKFGIVTGRGYVTITAELQRHRLDCDFLICNNGSLIFENGCVRHSVPIDGVWLKPLVDRVVAAGGMYAAINCLDRRICAIYGKHADEAEGDDFIALSHLHRLPEFNQVDTRLDSDEAARRLSDEINAAFDGVLTAHSNGSCVDTVAYGVGKAVGLATYLQLCGGQAQDLVTVGDNFNDVDMLEAFGGYVLESGNPAVIEKIGRTCKSVAALLGENVR